MPDIQTHTKLSEKRTGLTFKELHEWMNDKNYGKYRHNILNISTTIKQVRKRFGKEYETEFLYHIKDDYEKNTSWRIIKILSAIKQISLFPLKIFNKSNFIKK